VDIWVCYGVKNYAKSLNTELHFLPSYGPHLNIIERLWKWAKKDCLYKYYETFIGFKNAINTSLSKVGQQDYNEQLDSLPNLKFQTYSKSHIMTV
jgi:transposase